MEKARAKGIAGQHSEIASMDAGHSSGKFTREEDDDEEEFDQDSLMFDEMDEEIPDADPDDDVDITIGRGAHALSSSDDPPDEVDSSINTPYGSPFSDISSISNIQKWTGEVKKMLLDDQKNSESRLKGDVSPLPEMEQLSVLNPTKTEASGTEGDLETAFSSDSDLDFVIPTAEELAEKYSSELIEKEMSLLQKDAKIMELEKTQRDIKSTLEECQKELKLKSETAADGAEKLRKTVDEKDKCIMETSDKLRKITESYNLSEKRWKEQQEFLEQQILKVKEENNLGPQIAELKQSLEQKQHEMESVLAKLKNLEDELIESNQMAAKYEKMVEDVTAEKFVCTEKLHAFQASSAEAQQELQDLLDQKQKEVDVVTAKLKSLEDELIESSQMVAKYEKEIEEITIEKASCNERLQECMLELDNVRVELKEALETKQREIDVMAIKLTNLEDELIEGSQMSAKYENYDKIIEDLTAEKAASNERLQECMIELEGVRNELKEALAKKQREVDAMSEKLTSLEDEWIVGSQPSTNNETYERMLQEMSEEKEACTEKLQSCMREFEMVRNELKETLHLKQNEVDELTVKLQILEDEVEESGKADAGKEHYEKIIEEITAEKNSMNDKLQSSMAEVESVRRELKDVVDEKQQELDEMFVKLKILEDELDERNEASVSTASYEKQIQTITAEKIELSEKLNAEKVELNEQLNACKLELEIVKQELSLKAAEQELSKRSAESGDGWSEDAPVLLDEGFNEDNQIVELKQELSKKTEELTAATEKSRTMEDKLKKALKALKQKNEKLAELKGRLDEDLMNSSMMSNPATSLTPEPIVQAKAVSVECSMPSVSHAEVDDLRRENDEKSARIKQLEEMVQAMRAAQEQRAVSMDHETIVLHKEMEIASLQNQLSQLAATMDSKNEEIEQLMKTCGDMQNSIDEKVELLNECVGKKDEEVRQAISQYEECLKDATLNVSHLTQELEAKIRLINQLHAQVQEAQESLLDAQNDFDSYKAETQNVQDMLEEKEREIVNRQRVEGALRKELGQLQAQIGESSSEHFQIREALDRAEIDKQQLREDAACIQNEYLNKNSELQLKISSLMDQLNECEAAVSVMETRLKESDDKVNEIRYQLEERTKSNDFTEQSLFIKTEECVRVEERLREAEERHRVELESKVRELQEQHRVALESYALQNSSEFEKACGQLNQRNSEVVQLQSHCAVLVDQIEKQNEAYNAKCVELAQREQALQEMATLRGRIQEMDTSVEAYAHSLTTANEDLRGKAAEMEKLQAKLVEQEERLSAFIVSQEQAHAQLNETQAELNQCRQSMTTYYNDWHACKLEADNLRSTCDQYKEMVTALNSQLTTATSDSEKSSFELQNVQSQMSRYRNIEESLDKYLEDLNNATEELGKKNSEYRELEKSCKTQETQIHSLQASLEAVRGDVEASQTAIAERDGKIAALEEEIRNRESLREEFESHSSKYAGELTAQLEARSKELRETQAKLDDGALKEELEEKNREISDLRFELEEGILQEKSLKKTLESKDHEVLHLRDELSKRDLDIANLRQQNEYLASLPTVSADEPIAQRLESMDREKEVLERKIDLLQVKLAEVEASEVKCYEDFSKLKILRTELEMDNLRMSGELEQLRRSLQDGDHDPKYKSMENQIVLMSQTLEDRDALCLGLMKDISELQEMHDTLRIRVNELESQQLPSPLHPESMEAQLLDQDAQLFSLRVDLDRERKIRELYERQLFLATSKKQFESTTKKSSGWFGLSELFASPTPVTPPRPASSPRSTMSPSRTPPSSIVNYGASASPSFTSTPGRPITPTTSQVSLGPPTPTPAPLFDPLSGQQQMYLGQGPSSFLAEGVVGQSSPRVGPHEAVLPHYCHGPCS